MFFLRALVCVVVASASVLSCIDGGLVERASCASSAATSLLQARSSRIPAGSLGGDSTSTTGTEVNKLEHALILQDNNAARQDKTHVGQGTVVVGLEDTEPRQERIPDKFHGYSSRRAVSSDASVGLTLLQLQGSHPVLLPPSTEPYNFLSHRPDFSYSQYGQDKLLRPLFDIMGTGFFVESGARDGEQDSNTVFLEHRGWTGLLIEPSKTEYPRIASKHRKAYSFQGCLSPTTHSEVLHFSDSGDGLSHIEEKTSFVTKAEPLSGLLQPLMQNTVDFWSLDIEGSEGAVLESTDFEKIEVGLLMIEMNKGAENNRRIRAVMQKHRFVEIGTTEYNGGEVLDRIFANPRYFKARGLALPTHIANPNHLR